MMRIVGGRFRGKQLKTPSGLEVRPTTDRVRESLFNILSHSSDGDLLSGARVLDLFAGTGANGIEAMSRGASYALFVDNGTESRGLLRHNIMDLSLQGISKIWRRDATDLGPCAPLKPFDLVFIDPPYGKGLGEQALSCLAQNGWLSPKATLVLEEAKSSEITLPMGFEVTSEKLYGNTKLLILNII